MVTLPEYSLETVHQAFCPDSKIRQYQIALNDTLALEEVVVEVLKQTRWVMEAEDGAAA